MKKNRFFYFLLKGIIGLICIIVALIINSNVIRENNYLIPDIGIKIESKYSPNDDMWSIFFSKKLNDLELEKTSKVQVARGIGVQLIYNPLDDRVVYIVDNRGTIKINNSSNIYIQPISDQDSLFFQKRKRTEFIKVREPYLMLNFIESCDTICILNSNGHIVNKIPCLP